MAKDLHLNIRSFSETFISNRGGRTGACLSAHRVKGGETHRLRLSLASPVQLKWTVRGN